MTIVRRSRSLTLLTAVAAAWLTVPASATPVCDSLRAELSGASSPGAGPGRPSLADPSRAPLTGELRDLEDRAQALGCASGSVIDVGGPKDAACRQIEDLADDIRGRLQDAEAQQGAAAPDRAGIIHAMHDNGCAGTPPPIEGVSQFAPDSGADIEDLTPRGHHPDMPDIAAPVETNLDLDDIPDMAPGGSSVMPIHEPPKGHVPDLSDALKGAGSPGARPPALHAGKERPMTPRERSVRHVGPRFFPNPENGLSLDPKPHR